MATKAKITYGTGLKRSAERNRYDFDKLKKKDDYFEVVGLDKHASVRAQASKQGKYRGIRYSVTKTDSTPKAKKPGVIVRLESYIN